MITNRFDFNGTMEITTVIGCPMACSYCPQKKLIHSYLNKDSTLEMDFRTFQTCIDKIPKEVRIDFSGMAEPFLNPRCFQMIDYINQKGNPFQLYTTGVGMLQHEWNKIKEMPFFIVMIHLADKYNNTKIKITEEYLQLIKLIDSEDIDHVFFMSMGEKHEQLSFLRHQVENTTLHSRAGNLDREDVLSYNIGNGKLKCQSQEKLNHNVLMPNGDVYVCCMDYGLEYKLGNLLTDSYEDLFNSDSYKNLKNKMNTDNSDIICRKCYQAQKII